MATAPGTVQVPGRLALWAGVAWRAIVLLAALVLAGLVFDRLRLVFVPVLVAVVLATLLLPAVDALARRGWRRGLAAAAVMAAGLTLVAGVVALVIPPVLDQVEEFDLSVSGGIEEVRRWLTSGPLGLSEREVDRAFDRAQEELQGSTGVIADGALTAGARLLEALAGAILSVILLFFVLRDGRGIWRWIVARAGGGGPGLDRRGRGAWSSLSGYLRGIVLLALIEAVLVGIALVVLGIELALPIAVLTFFGAFIPFLGAFTVGGIATLVALFTEGGVTALLVLGVYVGIQQLEQNVLGPVVLARSIEVHPVVILLAVTAGGVLAGILGALLAPIVVALVDGALVRPALAAERPPEAPGSAQTTSP